MNYFTAWNTEITSGADSRLILKQILQKYDATI